MDEYLGEKLRKYFKPGLLIRVRSKNHELGRPTCAAPSELEALAFVPPIETLTDRQYGDFLTAINYVEVTTGLDLLSAWLTIAQDRVEFERASHLW